MIDSNSTEPTPVGYLIYPTYKRERNALVILSIPAVLIPVIFALYLFENANVSWFTIFYLVGLTAFIAYFFIVEQLRNLRKIASLNSSLASNRDVSGLDVREGSEIVLFLIARYIAIVILFRLLDAEELTLRTMHNISSPFKVALQLSILVFYGAIIVYYPLVLNRSMKTIVEMSRTKKQGT